jgi:ribosomal-protein-alanine N-acetyltransferase
MSVNLSTLKLAPMQMADLDEVVAIENGAQTHPWSRGNFIDSLVYTYDAWVVRTVDDVMLGFFVQMPVVDETHLLVIAVKKEMQGQGIGAFLLKHTIERAKLMKMEAVSLEVRVSNLRALAVYKAFGFLLVGRRKNYYVTGQKQQEDALILRYVLTQVVQPTHED